MLRTAAALSILCAAAAVLFFPVLLQGRILLPGDYLAHFEPWKTERLPNVQWNPLMWDALAQFYPWRLYSHTWISRGVIPLWNPHQFCGTPFLANLQSAVLYPPTALFVLMDPARAFGLCAALHLLLASFGAFYLARSFGVSRAGSAVSGLSFGFCSFVVSWAELPTVICTVAWLPWMLLATERVIQRPSAARAAALAVVIALCLLAGHLQMAFYCLIATVLWTVRVCLFRRRQSPQDALMGLVAVLGAMLLAGLLVSAQMLPTAELAGLSARSGERTAQAFTAKMATLLQPNKMVVAFLPKFYGSPSDGNYVGVWNYAEHAMYMGALSLLLAILGTMGAHRKGKWFFVVLAGISLVLATSWTANGVFYFGLPGYASFGSPARILVLWCFSAAMLAGMGLDHAMGLTCKDARRITLPVGAAIFLAAWGVAAALARRGLPEGMPDPAVWQAALSILVPGIVIMTLMACRAMSQRLGGALIAALVAADLLAANWGYNLTCRRSQVYPTTPLIAMLQTISEGDRILPINDRWSLYEFPNAMLPPNAAMVYGLNDAQGYDSLFPGAYKAWLRNALGEDPSPPENGNMVLLKHPSRAVLALGRYVVSAQPISAAGIRKSAWISGLYETTAEAGRGRLGSAYRGPNEFELRATYKSTSTLCVRRAYYPGWRAYVDRVPVGFASAGPTHISCRVPAGEHNIRLRYEPSSFRLGMYLSLVGLAALSALLGCAVARWGSR